MSKQYTIASEPPEGFKPCVEVASCYCTYQGKILLVLRHPEKLAGNTWGVPAGKLEKNEDPTAAVIREIWEEVGIDISGEGLAFLRTLYCRVPHYPQPDFIYHQFHKPFDTLPTVHLALEENIEARWVTVDEALELPLITGGKEAFSFYTNSLREIAL